MHKLTDKELLSLIQQGSHLAFAELVERHSESYYRLAFRFTNDNQQAEDIVQDAFIKLWERPKLWNENKQTQFTTWFYQVIINRCLDLKRKKPHFQIESINEINLPANHSSHEEQLVHLEMQVQLETLINELPSRQRVALNLCFFEDMSNQEAADIMNLSLKALQSLIMRGKNNIKNRLNSNISN
ncbi:RNA polymerase sigma factor [Hydrogenovibrio sp. JE_KL2]|jgi:RNA polymerase sigma-70 factor (ECF subfamily)|uniref:RNA polymerase sigma factor n=1 Tax=Hydrogenovibrio sp. JE_KL2 TaxID=2651188 RepID=UPI00128BFD30|nr:sigma-70 family RNA polymerase sigma factor [Hydrogenovibrio sp. JE_KL2]MPQ76800.1 sigma-70 family RNA polymerase sigma factor [Hydrogenovibrio sp. JE_KL2]